MPISIKLELQEIRPSLQTRFVKELEIELKRDVPAIKTEILSIPGNQDLGTILELVLAAPSVIIVAKGISEYLKRRNISKIKIKIGENTVTASNLDSKSIVKIVRELKDKL